MMVRTSMSPFGLIALLRQFRQRAVGGIADHAQCGKGNAGLGGIGGGDMAFHVDGGSARLRMQRGLAGLRGNDPLDAGESAAHHAAARSSAAALAIISSFSAMSARNGYRRP